MEQEYRELYMSPQSFLLKFNATERAVCPEAVQVLEGGPWAASARIVRWLSEFGGCISPLDRAQKDVLVTVHSRYCEEILN